MWFSIKVCKVGKIFKKKLKKKIQDIINRLNKSVYVYQGRQYQYQHLYWLAGGTMWYGTMRY